MKVDMEKAHDFWRTLPKQERTASNKPYRLNSVARCWAKASVKLSPPTLGSVYVFRTL